MGDPAGEPAMGREGVNSRKAAAQPRDGWALASTLSVLSGWIVVGPATPAWSVAWPRTSPPCATAGHR